MSGFIRDEQIRMRIQAVSDLPEVADQMATLIKLQQDIIEASKQAALSARTDAIQQVNAINGITQALSQQQQQQQQTSSQTTQSQQDALTGMEDLSSSVRSFTGLIAAAFTFHEIKSFVSDVIEAKTQIDSVKIALDTMLGSKKAEEEMYAQFVQLAKTSPFDLETISDQGKKLLAYNVSAQDLIPTLTNLGNVAAAVGLEKLPQITLAYGQIINMGRLMGQETRQLIEAGIDIYGLLGDAMGKTRQEVQKMAADHLIMAEDVKKAFDMASAEGGKYEGMMAKLSTTVGGQISNMGDIFFQAKGRIGDFFEGSIRDGIGIMNNLMESTIGSNSAISRSLDILKSAAAAVLTYTIATKAQAAADMIVNGYTAIKTVLYGEYLLAQRAITAQQIIFTAAEMEAVAAAEAFNLAIASNPVGALVTVVLTGVSAFYAWKAATDEVVSSLGEQEIKLKQEQTDLNTLTKAAMLESTSKEDRVRLIKQLIQQYPEYFKGINAETVGNAELQSILDAVNKSYQQRINLAREAYKADQIKEQQTELFKAEDELFARVKATGVISAEVLAGMGNNVQKLQEYIGTMGNKAMELNNGWDTFFKGTIGEATNKLVAQQKELETQSQASSQRVIAYNEQAQKAAVDAEVQRWNNQVVNLKQGSKEYEAAEDEHQIALQKIYGTYKEKTVKVVTDTADKVKTITLLSESEIKEITEAGEADKEVDRMKDLKAQLDYLNTQEQNDINAVKKAVVNKKASNAQIAALQVEARQQIADIDAEYDKKRAIIQAQIEDETMKTFLTKVQDTNDKVAELTAKREEAEAMLTKLNDAKTYDQKIAAVKEYNEKYLENVDSAIVAERKMQLDASTIALNDIYIETGGKGKAYRDAYAKYLADDLAYENALTKQATDGAKNTAKNIEQYEKEIQAAHKETAHLEQETLQQQLVNRAEYLNGLAQLISKDGSMIGQIGAQLVTLYSSLSTFNTKALDTAKEQLDGFKMNLADIYTQVDASTERGKAAIAVGEKQVAQGEENVAKAEGMSIQAGISLAGTVYQVLSTIANVINEAIAAKWQAVADAYGKIRQYYKDTFDYINKLESDSYKQDLADFKGTTDEKIAFIDRFYDEQKQQQDAFNKTDNTIAYYQELAQAGADFAKDAKKGMQDLANLQADDLARKNEQVKAAAAQEIQHAADVRDAKIKAIDDELDAFKAAKQAEIDADKAALDAQLAANEQFYADKDLRLTKDDVYRADLLAKGEAREVQAMQDAEARELQRAQESGASAEEVARIKNAFEALIADVHAKYEDAKGDKEKEIALANQETAAQEADVKQKLQQETADKTNALLQQIVDAEDNASQEKILANYKYKQEVEAANQAIFESQKALTIAQLQAQIAILNGQKSWTGIGNGKINDAINQLNDAIAQISGTVLKSTITFGDFEQAYGMDGGFQKGKIYTKDANGKAVELPAGTYYADNGREIVISSSGDINQNTIYDGSHNAIEVLGAAAKYKDDGSKYFYHGTDYLERNGAPVGRDTIRIHANEGERILPTHKNLEIGGRSLTNDQLVDKIKFYDRFAALYPSAILPTWNPDQVFSRLGLPADVLQPQLLGPDLSDVRSDLQQIGREIRDKQLVSWNVDADQFSISLLSRSAKQTYYGTLFQE